MLKINWLFGMFGMSGMFGMFGASGFFQTNVKVGAHKETWDWIEIELF